jgi:hypothetical protein
VPEGEKRTKKVEYERKRGTCDIVHIHVIIGVLSVTSAAKFDECVTATVEAC